MGDNTTLPGGDVIRDIDRTTAKTQVVQLDAGGAAVEKLIIGGQQLMANSVPIVWPADENPLVVARDDVQYDDNGIQYVNPNVPGADIATGDLQLQTVIAINGAPLRAAPATNVAVGTTSVLIVAANLGRKGLQLSNVSSSTQRIALSLNGSDAVVDAGIVLWPGNVWWMDRYSFTTGPVKAIANLASGALAVQEFN